jgi:hypothetical protein
MRWQGRTPWPHVVVDGNWEEEAEHSTSRNKSQERWVQGKRRSDLWILSPLSTPVMGNRLMRCLVFTLPAQVYPRTDRGPRARPLVNKSQKIGETDIRRRSVPCNPPRLCVVSRHFRNHDHDCLSLCISCGAVRNCCLGKRQARCYDTHAIHLDASVTDQISSPARWWNRTTASKMVKYKYHQSCAGKMY